MDQCRNGGATRLVSGGMMARKQISSEIFRQGAKLESDGLSVTLESKLGSKTVASWQGKHMGHFKLLSMLGRGGMGMVIRAEDRGLNRHVALKVLPQNAGKATVRVEQFIREARSAAKLDHPNIVTIHEVGDAAGYYYIAMELVEGGNLFELVKANGPLDVAQACQIVAEAGEALAYAHRMGVIHRDIKPANLMLTRTGRCKVTDFGLAKIEDPADLFDLPQHVIGTPTYIPPEVAAGQPATAASDIYCLGATLWYLLVGLPPFDGKTSQEVMWKHVNAPLPKLRKFRPELSKSLVKAIARCLAKKPEERFSSVDEFAKILRTHTIGMVQTLDGLGKIIHVPKNNPRQWWSSNKWRLTGIAATLAVALGVAALKMTGVPVSAEADVGSVEELVPANDLPTLTRLVNREIKGSVEVQGRVSSLELSRRGRFWALRFEGADNHSGFRAVFPRELGPQMEKRFGGTFGAGVIGKRVILQGNLSQPPDESVQMQITRPQQVTVVGD